jgi:hypothetical protein
MAAPDRVRSLDIVFDEVRAERDHQLQYFDALDQKAGIVLGFAGALVALAPPRPDLLLIVGRAAAVLSGFFCLSTFWPRRYWSTDLRPFRDKYLAAEPSFTRLRLLDTKIEMIERIGTIVRGKALRLKLAMSALAIGVLLTAVALGLDSP